jgi:hypothetical protein
MSKEECTMNFGLINFIFKRDLKYYMPRIINSNKSIDEMIRKLKQKYSKKEIVEYFRNHQENSFVALAPEGDLFLHGSRMLSFDAWLNTVVNLMIFSKAQETYENHIDKNWSKEQQLSYAKNLCESRIISHEQYLYMLEIVECLVDINEEKY